MSQEYRGSDTVLTNIIGKTGSLEGIMLCLRFLAIQAVSQGRTELAMDIETLLEDHEESNLDLQENSDSLAGPLH